MQNQAAARPQVLGGLASILGGLGGCGLLNQVTGPEPTGPSAVIDVLDHIFELKDAGRALETGAAGRSGLSPDLLKGMLPLVARLGTGYFAKQAGGGAKTDGRGLSGVLGSVLGGGGGGSALNDVLNKLGC